MTTIYDVARLAGVSPTTVSRLLNGATNVTPAYAEAIRQAAADLDYVPNRNARRLRRSAPEIVAMIIPDVANPFFTHLTRAVEDVARESGLSVMLCDTDDDPGREQEYLRVAVSEPAAGIVIVPSSPETDLGFALQRRVPVVCVDRPLPRFPVDSVVLDDVVGATQAMGLLFAAGYNRVACATGPEHVPTASNRAAGWRLAYLERTGGEPPEGYLDFSSYSVAGGEAAARRLLALPEPPDAFFAANNRIAMGVLTVLAERGLMPPATGLLSFGDLGLPQVLLPPRGVISTTLPERELGLAAARQLLERVAGADGPARHLVVPMTVEPPDR